jgi:hypothetical protein
VSAMDGRIDLTASSKGTGFNIYIPCKTQSSDRPSLSIVPSTLSVETG